jgi:flagellar hook assembly protein FlgD
LLRRVDATHGEMRYGFELDRERDVEAIVYSLEGRRLASPLRAHLAAGNHTAHWDGRDDAGRLMPIGLYLIRIESR